jgi:putative ATP-dependent endonuclease of the OLD family
MYISRIRVENFRSFGTGMEAFQVCLSPGLTAFVGENDSGKTTVIDALRLILGTRDLEYFRYELGDFHFDSSSRTRATEIRIQCSFEGLTPADRGAFAEYTTYSNVNGNADVSFHMTWIAKRQEADGALRRFSPIELRSGVDGTGPVVDANTRALLCATYLRPLRDAERALSSGRGSRLAQILQHTKEVKSHGTHFDKNVQVTDPKSLSVLGLGDYTSHLLGESEGIKKARQNLNEKYLSPLAFSGDPLSAGIFVNSSSDDSVRLRQLLEKLEVGLLATEDEDDYWGRGLGSNNLLFMACELLLLASEDEGFPILLIEEPEAHLHPQRQVRLIRFLQDRVREKRADGQQIQILLTTHSPNLASTLPLEDLILFRRGRAFPLKQGMTKLDRGDYSFLQRFLDVTKANLFFSRGVLIVEGDAEAILLPTIATLIGRDLHEYGASIVNVGGVGFGRYARIFMRENPAVDGEIAVPAACIADMDVMPDEAPWLVGILKDQEPLPDKAKRRWRITSDYDENGLARRRRDKVAKANEQRVLTFVSDHWTLEFDLAHCGLGEEMSVAVALAKRESEIAGDPDVYTAVIDEAIGEYADLKQAGHSPEALSCLVAAPLINREISKPMCAQYLAQYLLEKHAKGELDQKTLVSTLPEYLVKAIEHVTAPIEPLAP